jgi:hypothetical protein
VNALIEMADMREANRSYEANLQVIKQARAMVASVHRRPGRRRSPGAASPAGRTRRPRAGRRQRPGRRLRAGEAASIAGIQGKASTQQVVEAVMSAEQSLQT